MRFLLDTHALIWLIEASAKISPQIRDMLGNSDNTVYLSSISLWEIAIKIALGKLELRASFDQLLDDIAGTNIVVLHIEKAYLTQLFRLPTIHKDPFDRLLISTALAEGLTIVTADENIHRYGASWIW